MNGSEEIFIDYYNGMKTSADRSFLRNIAYLNTGASSGVSRALLLSFEEFVPLPYYHSGQIHFRNSVDNDNEITYAHSNRKSLSIYPNPSDSEITIEWQVPELTCTNLVVYDFFGKKVVELSGENKVPIQLRTDNWKEGVYLIFIKSLNGSTYSGKVLILR